MSIYCLKRVKFSATCLLCLNFHCYDSTQKNLKKIFNPEITTGRVNLTPSVFFYFLRNRLEFSVKKYVILEASNYERVMVESMLGVNLTHRLYYESQCL